MTLAPELFPSSSLRGYDPRGDHQDTLISHGRADITGGVVNYTYEEPLEEVVDEVPLLLIPGYTAVESNYQDLRTEIARRGKPAITLRPLRRHSPRVALHPNYFLKPSALPSRSAYGVLKDVREARGLDALDAAGHSMGGWVLSLLAQRHPGALRSATFVASAGLEDHSLASLTRRMPDFLAHEVLPNLKEITRDGDPQVVREALHYLWRSPLRTCAEGVGVSGCDIRPALAHIGNAGIRTAILNFASDRLICNRTTETEVGHLVDHCETHPQADLGHLAPYLDPEPVADSLVAIIHKITQDT